MRKIKKLLEYQEANYLRGWRRLAPNFFIFVEAVIVDLVHTMGV